MLLATLRATFPYHSPATWVSGPPPGLPFLPCCHSPLWLCVSSLGFHCSMESRACALPILLTQLARPTTQGLRRTHQCGHQLSPQHCPFPLGDVVYEMTQNCQAHVNLRPTSRNSVACPVTLRWHPRVLKLGSGCYGAPSSHLCLLPRSRSFSSSPSPSPTPSPHRPSVRTKGEPALPPGKAG